MSGDLLASPSQSAERAVRRIIYDVAVSLDGFIAGHDGDISAFPAEGPHLQPYVDRLSGYGTAIMGRKTYEFGYRFGLTPGARAYPHMDHHIFSRSLELPKQSEVAVVRRAWRATLAKLRRVQGQDIYLCGGGAFAGFVANAGLLDLLRLKIAPVAIGSGVRLFEGLVHECRFEQISNISYANGVVLAEYRVRPAAIQDAADTHQEAVLTG